MSTRSRRNKKYIVETNNTLLFNPISEIINKWDEIVVRVNKMIEEGTLSLNEGNNQ